MPQFPGVIKLSGLDGTNGFRLDGIDAGDISGHEVSAAGDVNGDGFDDILIGAIFANPGGNTDAGETYVVFGKASGFAAALDLAALNGTNGFRLPGIDAGDGSGDALSSAGDLNGDGFDDILIVAPGGDPGGDTNAGETYVVFGKASGFAASFKLATLNGTNGFRLDGIDAGDSCDWVSSAGDVNGDAFDDILIGSFAADAGGDSDAGESYLVFGKASGFAAALDLAALNGTNGFRLDGIDAGDLSGTVSSAGDVNGDGFDDILIGGQGGDPGGSYDAGESYVVFGKASGFAAVLDLASLNGTNGFRLDGIDSGDVSGRWGSVSSAGDVNSDGFDDILIGALAADGGAGETYVVFGKASGFAASFDLASLNGTNGFRLDGIDAEDHSGWFVSSAGDVNGDGFDDILISAVNADPGGRYDAGESYVVFGKASGFASATDLASLDGTTGFRLEGIDAGDGSSLGLSGAGDVNGDGFDDIVIGAFAADPGGDTDAGESYVVFGHKPLVAVDRVGTDIANRINGGDRNDTLSGLAGDDTLIGHAGRDQILGGLGNDTVTGGTGNDTVEGGAGSDDLDGGDDEDWLSYASSNATIAVNLNTGTASGGHAAGDSVLAFENVLGSSFDDTLTGSIVRNRLDGGAGADTLSGLDGHDVLLGGAGGDRLHGGADRDVASYATAGAAVSIDLADLAANTGNAKGDTYISIELFRLSAFDDVFSGIAQNQCVFGGAGDDTITGGGGADRLIGGLGADVFAYNAINESQFQACDWIFDFKAASLDRIDLSAIDAIPGGIDDAFSFIGSATFTGLGQVRAYEHNGNTFVDVNTAGNNAPDMRIVLFGIITLDQADFVL